MISEYKTDKNRLAILEIERFAVHDGPGIRTVVFLQGCPLRCPWCSNPESRQRKTHLLHKRDKCVGCGRCQMACPEGNISFPAHLPVFNRDECPACGACADICPQGAIKFAGKTLTPAEIVRVLLRDKDYYSNSRGGVTFSGGEAFTQFGGLIELLVRCKKEGLHTAVETCGQVDFIRIKRAYPLIDLFLFDIKHMDKELLKTVTGADLEPILKNLRYISHKNPRKIIIRVPVIPGFNSDEKTLLAIFSLATENRIREVHLLPYHTLGKDKYEQMGLPYPYPYLGMLTKEDLLPFKETGEKMGLKIRIGG